MTNDAKSRRRLPVFSIRTLLVAMTLFCAYAACWRPTATSGVADVESRRDEILPPIPTKALAPLVVSTEDIDVTVNGNQLERTILIRYYLWFFGSVIELPFRRAIPDELLAASAPDSGAYAEDVGLIGEIRSGYYPRNDSLPSDSRNTPPREHDADEQPRERSGKAIAISINESE